MYVSMILTKNIASSGLKIKNEKAILRSLKTANKSVKAIETETGLSHETLRVRLLELKKRELITQVPGNDRRSKIYSLTSHGFLKLNELDEGLKAESFMWLLNMFLNGGMLTASFLDNRLPADELNRIKEVILDKLLPLFQGIKTPPKLSDKKVNRRGNNRKFKWVDPTQFEAHINEMQQLWKKQTEEKSWAEREEEQIQQINALMQCITNDYIKSFFEVISSILEIYRRNNIFPPYQPRGVNLNQLKQDIGETVLYIAARAVKDDNPDYLNLLQYLPQLYYGFIKTTPIDIDYILSNISIINELDKCFSTSQNITLKEYKAISDYIEISKNMHAELIK